MNQFSQMAVVLAQVSKKDTEKILAIPNAKSSQGMGKTERIRQLLKASARPMTAEEICWDMEAEFPNFRVHLVYLLLKYDISKGRILFSKSKYAWSYDFDTAESAAIRDAVKLLKRHGYRIQNPDIETT